MKNIKKYAIIAIFLAVLISPNISSADTIADLQVQINALLAQIQQLQQQLAQMQGQPVTWCHDFNVNLKIGDEGEEVIALENALVREGLLKRRGGNGEAVVPRTNFDEVIASAVSGFQQKYKDEILAPWGLQYGTGFVGSTTRAKLNSLYGCGIPIPPTPPVSTNQPPVISGVSGPTALNVGQTGTWIVKAYDPEQGVLTYSVLWGDETPLVLPTVVPQSSVYTQTATFTHSYSKAGIYNPTFTVTDNQGLSAKTSISVNVGETAQIPYYTIEPAGTLVRGQTYIFTGKITNGKTNSQISFYLQRPDGSMKYSDYYVGYTDGSGNYNISTSQTLTIEGQNGNWISWITASGIASNKQYHNVIGATTQPSITVLSPNGGEVWEIGKSYTISWKSVLSQPETSYGIELFYRPEVDPALGGEQPIMAMDYKSSYQWTIPSNITPISTNLYRIIVHLTDRKGNIIASDQSDAAFSIVAAVQPSTCSISFNPSTINKGQTTTSSWSSTNDADGRVHYVCKCTDGQCESVNTTYGGKLPDIYEEGDLGASGSTSNEFGPPETVKCTVTTVNSAGQQGSCSATLNVLQTSYTYKIQAKMTGNKSCDTGLSKTTQTDCGLGFISPFGCSGPGVKGEINKTNDSITVYGYDTNCNIACQKTVVMTGSGSLLSATAVCSSGGNTYTAYGEKLISIVSLNQEINQMASVLESAKNLLYQLLQALKNL